MNGFLTYLTANVSDNQQGCSIQAEKQKTEDGSGINNGEVCKQKKEDRRQKMV